MGHRLGCTGELAPTLVTAGREVAPCGVVQVLRGLDVNRQISRGLPCPEPGDSFVSTAQVVLCSLAGLVDFDVVGWSRKIRIGAVVPRCVPRMVDGPRQVVGCRAILASNDQFATGLGPERIAIQLGRPIGPLAQSLVGPARNAVAGSQPAQQCVRLSQVSAGLSVGFLLALAFALGLAAAAGRPVGGVCGGSRAAKATLATTEATVAISLVIMVFPF